MRERPCPHPGCNKVFMIDRYLQRHIKLIHTGEAAQPQLSAAGGSGAQLVSAVVMVTAPLGCCTLIGRTFPGLNNSDLIFLDFPLCCFQLESDFCPVDVFPAD